VSEQDQPDANAMIARLLVQATYGPSRASMKEYVNTANRRRMAEGDVNGLAGVSSWIQGQMALAPTFSRAYYRERSNPRLPAADHVGRIIGPCERQSRWHKFAFNQRDLYQKIEVQEAATEGMFRLSINGLVRTEVPIFDKRYYGSQHHAVCGGANAWDRNYCLPKTAADFEKVGVRCCADSLPTNAVPISSGGSWYQRCPDYSPVWASSSDPANGVDCAGPGAELTYSDAKARCEAQGARLCTYEEVENNCAFSTGCMLDNAYVWTSKPHTPLKIAQASSSNATAAGSSGADFSNGGKSVADICADGGGACCTVIFGLAEGKQCDAPAPVWELSNWVHPGGDFVTGAGLCGTTVHNWLSKAGGSHASAGIDPADASQTGTLTGGGVKVGEFYDPACGNAAGNPQAEKPKVTYKLCEVFDNLIPDHEFAESMLQSWSDGLMTLSTSEGCTKNQVAADGGLLIEVPNPGIHFINPDAPEHKDRFNDWATLEAHLVPFMLGGDKAKNDVAFLDSLSGASQAGCMSGKPYMRYNGTFYMHDPRLKLIDNTLDNVAGVAGSTRALTPEDARARWFQCPRVAKTFVNRATCGGRDTGACAARKWSDATVVLNESTIKEWYARSRRHVHYITGLRFETPGSAQAKSPCTDPSRWMRRSAAGEACPASSPESSTLSAGTIASLKAALAAAAAAAPLRADGLPPQLLDLAAQTDGTCSTDAGAVVLVGADSGAASAGCWEHVHSELHNVYDFSWWTLAHGGNDQALTNNRPSPIAKWAEQGSAFITYPTSHMQSRWTAGKYKMHYIGRLGDTIAFSALPKQLQTKEMAQLVGAVEVTDSSNSSSSGGGGAATDVALGSEGDADACGSPGEVANKPELGHHFYFHTEKEHKYNQNELDFSKYDRRETKVAVWANTQLKAQDQLRQRVAWAFLQTFVVSETGIGKSQHTEEWLVYFDIFVRHAFGNFRDVVREVSYNGLMGEYLTFRQNKAHAFEGTYPDGERA
jgi:hypothetical protein